MTQTRRREPLGRAHEATMRRRVEEALPGCGEVMFELFDYGTSGGVSWTHLETMRSSAVCLSRGLQSFPDLVDHIERHRCEMLAKTVNRHPQRLTLWERMTLWFRPKTRAAWARYEEAIAKARREDNRREYPFSLSARYAPPETGYDPR